SASIRETHYPDLIHWQFANTRLELGTRPGLVMAVPRYDDITRPTATSDRTLTPGTTLDSGSQALSEKDVTVTLLELGLGKDASNNPIGVSTFINAYSINELESIIVGKLGRDYQFTKDLFLRTEWFNTDRIVYNDAGQVTTTASDVATGDDGTMTEEFLISLRSYMRILEIPPYMDGCYGIAMNEYAIAQFMQSKSSKERDQALADQDLVTRMLAQSTLQDFGGEVTGYRGKFDGFHIFEQNVYGKGANGTEGSNTVTLGAGSTLMHTSFAFGQNTVCWCTGLPVEIRTDEVRDFGRQQRMIWYAHEASGRLNVRNTTATGE
ncbi:MAG: hypothetical protein AAFU78_23670, partial [Cyanobacteria bacterium J06633_2]